MSSDPGMKSESVAWLFEKRERIKNLDIQKKRNAKKPNKYILSNILFFNLAQIFWLLDNYNQPTFFKIRLKYISSGLETRQQFVGKVNAAIGRGRVALRICVHEVMTDFPLESLHGIGEDFSRNRLRLKLLSLIVVLKVRHVEGRAMETRPQARLHDVAQEHALFAAVLSKLLPILLVDGHLTTRRIHVRATAVLAVEGLIVGIQRLVIDHSLQLLPPTLLTQLQSTHIVHVPIITTTFYT